MSDTAVAPAAGDPWKGCNPLDPSFKNDPYPSMHRLREQEPVNFVEPFQVWRLFRYADIVKLFREAPAGTVGPDGSNPGRDHDSPRGGFRDFMLEQEGPRHARLRRLVAKAFTPKRIEMLRGEIQAIVDDLLDRIEAKGSMDLIADYAQKLPGTVTCQMLGVPLEDRDRFSDWTAARTNAFFDSVLSEELRKRAYDAGEALADYFEDLIPKRREALGDDLLSGLIRAEEEGDRLSMHEVVVHVIGLLVAGYETTIGVIGNGIRALLRHPHELARLTADPSLLESCVDECLRFEGPILFNWRILWDDYEFGGRRLPAGSQIWAMLGSGSRDPERFPDPDRFDIGRTDNDHLGFGGGRHYCLGNHLARVETRIAIDTLFRRFPEVRLASDDVVWSHSMFRVAASIPLELE